MPARRVEITVSEETWHEIEAARGETSRAAWIKTVIAEALDRAQPPPEGPAGEMAERLEHAIEALHDARRMLAGTTDTGTDAV